MVHSYHSAVPSRGYHLPRRRVSPGISGDLVVSIEEQHVALPKLYGAPAYGRPPRLVDDSPRPPDPDDLPIAAVQTEEEREIASSMPAHAYASAVPSPDDGRNGHRGELTGRPFRLRALAGRILRGK